ncbi:DNA repair protein RecO [Labilibacter sediminis]|nr:DNA repair protein RecO [Labilibacter sediminis]
MIESTRGIVLTHTKYAESSVVSHIYTEKFGLQSYMINQVRSRKNRGKTVFLQPLTLVDLEVYHSNKKTIHRIKDFKVNTPFVQIPFEHTRRSIAFFIAEVLNSSFRLEDKLGTDVFDFLHQSISVLDSPLPGVQNFHIFLLFRLTQPLGFYPHYKNLSNEKFFDLKTGDFVTMEPSHHQFMNVWQTQLLVQLKDTGIGHLNELDLSGEQRTEFLEKFLLYYQLHLSGFSTIKSFKVLKDLFR